LEDSIARHKLHIQKLELMLRFLDNDELSPEQVNDVKDFVEDYVERNQVPPSVICICWPTYFDS
jgi:CCR4-NOT transcription complex subunit 3